ncbi:MAG: alpha/beta hydrolase [Candidatus Neomarinimicrobiota bacterium]
MECLIRGIPVYYQIFGSGRPVLMIHGFGPDHRLMAGCLEPVFCEHPGWRRVYFDLPGMGRTPAGDQIVDSDRMLEIVLEFIDTVLPGEKFTLAGESYGGYLARAVLKARFDQVAGLLLLCPLIIPEQQRRQLPPAQVLVRDRHFLERLSREQQEAFDTFAVVQTETTWQRSEDEVMVGLNAADMAFLERLQLHGYPLTGAVDELPSLYQRPALFLLGRQDWIVGYRDIWPLLEDYPRATLAILDQAGHNLQIEQAELFNSLTGEWLERVAAEMSADSVEK